MLFSQSVLAKFYVSISQVVFDLCHVFMVFTENLFFNGQSLLIVFFSLTVLTKLTVNPS